MQTTVFIYLSFIAYLQKKLLSLKFEILSYFIHTHCIKNHEHSMSRYPNTEEEKCFSVGPSDIPGHGEHTVQVECFKVGDEGMETAQHRWIKLQDISLTCRSA